MSTSKKNTKAPNSKEEKEKSYLDIINDYLFKTENDEDFQEKIQSIIKSDEYKIYEDLKIISEVAKDESDTLGPKFWSNLKEQNILKRSQESMRDRYKSFLQHLEREDFDQILKFINSSGLYGYLLFEKNPIKGRRRLTKIIVENDLKKKQLQTVDHKCNSQKFLDLHVEKQTKTLREILEKITPKYDENQECEIVEVSLKNGDRIIKKTKLDQIQQDTENDEKDDLYTQKLQEIAKKYNQKIEDVLLIVEQASGNIPDVIKYFDEGIQNILWSQKEDQILKSKKMDKNYAELIKQKGEKRVKERQAFLNLIN